MHYGIEIGYLTQTNIANLLLLRQCDEVTLATLLHLQIVVLSLFIIINQVSIIGVLFLVPAFCEAPLNSSPPNSSPSTPTILLRII